MKNPIKIPSTYFVGILSRKDRLPLGYITPYGTDAAAKSRMNTVTSWIIRNSRASGHKLPTSIIDNEPMSGFRILNCHQGRAGGDTWRIEDPRGFELEVSGTNVIKLLKTSTVQNGEILDPCIWARNGSVNVLLSTESDEFKQAVSNTIAAKNKASWRDVKPGNRIVLQNNLRGVFLGKMWLISYGLFRSQHQEIGNNDLLISPKAVYVIFDENGPDKKSSFSSSLHLISTPKLSSIEDKTEVDSKECEMIANDRLHDSSCMVLSSSYYRSVALTVNRPDLTSNIKVNEIPVNFTTETELLADLTHRNPANPAIFVKTPTEFGKLSHYRNFTIVEHSYEHLKQNELRRKLHLSPSRNSVYNLFSERSKQWQFNTTDELMNLEVEVSTEYGNIFKYFIV